MDEAPVEESIAAAGRRHPVARAAFVVAKWALAATAVLFFLRLLRRVDWPLVWDAVTHLEAWQGLVLLGLVRGRTDRLAGVLPARPPAPRGRHPDRVAGALPTAQPDNRLTRPRHALQ